MTTDPSESVIELNRLNNQNQELIQSLNTVNSDLQVCTEENKQLKTKIEQLDKKILELEGEKLQLTNTTIDWEKQYAVTLELFYQQAFALLNTYNSRRLNILDKVMS